MNIIDFAHCVEDMREDGMGFLAADCACGWKCPPCPDEDTCIDFLMQHAYEAGFADGLAATEGDGDAEASGRDASVTG